MKQIFLLFIACLTLQIAARAQEAGNLPCPKISIMGPAAAVYVENGEPMVFTVSLENKPENLKLEYVWNVTAGKIVEGQGTPTIEVDIKGLSSQSITATVEIKGLPENCLKTVSEMSWAKRKAVHNCQDGYDGKVSAEIKSFTLDQVTVQLGWESNISVVFRLYFAGKPTQKQINSRILSILKHFSSRKKLIQLDRITFVILENDPSEYTRICYFTKGQEETFCADCKVIKGLDVDISKFAKSK